MQKRIILITLISTCIAVLSAAGQPHQDLELTTKKISSNIVHLLSAQNAIYSPSGKFVAIQVSARFILLPAKNLVESFDDPSKLSSREGQILGFLPSGTLVFSDDEELFGLEPQGQKIRKLMPLDISEQLPGRTFFQNKIVIVSEDLMIIGAGGYDMEDHWGNIYRYDVKGRRLTPGARVKQFWHNMLSPSRNYILYEYGGELSNFINFYDIRQDKNFEAAAHFNLRKEFPKFRKTAEFPLLWVGQRDRFLAVIHSGLRPGTDELTPEEEEEQNKIWLALFDIPQQKIIWKKLAYRTGYPSSYQMLDDNKALADYGDEVYELSLTDGKERRIPAIDGRFLSVSPDKRKIAFIKDREVYTAAPDGSNKKLILELPADWKHAADYKNVGVRPPMWLANGDTLILFGELQLLVVQL